MLEKVEVINMEKVMEEFESMTKDAEKVQRETLRRILEDNSSAEYLQNLGLNGRTDPESFKACVPLATHKDLEPFIYRILEGDDSPILTGKSITTMSLSSGTTQGKPKYIPWNDELFESTMQIYKTSFAFRNREFPIKNGKALNFIYGSKQFKTKGGLIATTATTNVFRNPSYKPTMKALQSQCCSPDEVIFGGDFFQSLYCHLLCGLIFREEVQLVSSTFAHSIVHAFRAFEQVWEELCNDIREGVLTSRVTVPSIRTAMSKLLKPNPELANVIHKKCSGLSNWYGLIPELFPNAKYIYGIMTGSMEPYLEKLRHYAGVVPLLTADYGASEGWIAANVNPKLPPELATYAVLPQIAYFEFIPLSQLENEDTFSCVDPHPVGLTEVKIGEEYEIVMTTFSDIDLQLAVEAAAKLLVLEKLEVVEFTSHVDLSTEPGHYVIFWEISGEASGRVLSECCNCLDRSFIDAGYTSSRKVNAIGALELRVVRKGTFQKILDHYLGLGTAVSQYKTPRCVGPTHNTVLQILSENVVNRFFSSAFN
ncbi:Jasmonoyl--L-amino acid synthetase jar4, variant 2 [Lathyrus oleraceus]|uniref:Jasmonoyl--L-amino acid synthetase jar4, variant 2 n=1 Tax=Pisum sativum TaxID=3888 RepID=A0A9D4XRP3_PEA|nr:Jasmonoyl--L-amino acid synthetase jar4, variant 2 [Pisum sativum]